MTDLLTPTNRAIAIRTYSCMRAQLTHGSESRDFSMGGKSCMHETTLSPTQTPQE